MKKTAVLFCCFLLLSACSAQNKESQNTNEKQNTSESSTPAESLQLKDWELRSSSQGDGNEQGFYRIKTLDTQSDRVYSNILYTDYKAKKEVYLCDKPECKHNDASCTSYVEGIDMVMQLIVYKEHIYLICNEGYKQGENKELVTLPPRILQIGLDGKNKKELVTLPAGYSFSYESMAVGNGNLYASVEKTEDVETSSSETAQSYTQVVREKKLYAFQLQEGTSKVVADMKNKSITGASGQDIIANAYLYKTDPEELLDKKDFEGYNKAAQDASIAYQRISVKTGKMEKSVKLTSSLLGVCLDSMVYYTDDNGMLMQLNMKDGKTKELLQLDDPIASLMYADHDHIFLYSNDKEYVYSMKENTLTPFTLSMRDTQEPIRLLGKNSTMYYVIYDQTGEVKKTWAGTDQYEASGYNYGMMSKDDYWSSTKSYQPVDALQEAG